MSFFSYIFITIAFSFRFVFLSTLIFFFFFASRKIIIQIPEMLDMPPPTFTRCCYNFFYIFYCFICYFFCFVLLTTFASSSYHSHANPWYLTTTFIVCVCLVLLMWEMLFESLFIFVKKRRIECELKWA